MVLYKYTRSTEKSSRIREVHQNTRTTLQRYLKTGLFEKKNLENVTIFSPEQETELLKYVFDMDDLFYGFSKKKRTCL